MYEFYYPKYCLNEIFKKLFLPFFVTPTQAGFTSLEVTFEEWQWEEELKY